MPNVRAHAEPDLLAMIAVGGAAGALARHGVDVLLTSGSPDGAFPWATFVVNLMGAFGLGALHAYVPAHPRVPRRVRAVLGAGLLGGFTTFSAYAEDARDLLAAGRDATAVVYVVGTLAAAVLAVEAARWVVPRRGR